jgi:hypothetical protein
MLQFQEHYGIITVSFSVTNGLFFSTGTTIINKLFV